MFDLGTILYLNNNPFAGVANPAVAVSIARGGVALKPSTERKRAFARRVELYARDAGVMVEEARRVVAANIRREEREQRGGEAA